MPTIKLSNKFIIFIFAVFTTLFVIRYVHSQEIEFSNVNFKFTEKTLNVQIHKNADNFKIENIDITTNDSPYLSDYELWKSKTSNGKIISFKNETLGYFGIDNNLSVGICTDKIDSSENVSGGCIEQSEGELTVQLPYFPNGKYADIYDPSGKKVLTIDLSSKATCNENDQCDRPIEDSENCPQDCKKNEPKIDPAVVQLAAVNQQKEVQAEDGKISLADLGWWGIAIVIVLLAGGIGYWVYRRNRDSAQ